MSAAQRFNSQIQYLKKCCDSALALGGPHTLVLGEYAPRADQRFSETLIQPQNFRLQFNPRFIAAQPEKVFDPEKRQKDLLNKAVSLLSSRAVEYAEVLREEYKDVRFWAGRLSARIAIKPEPCGGIMSVAFYGEQLDEIATVTEVFADKPPGKEGGALRTKGETLHEAHFYGALPPAEDQRLLGNSISVFGGDVGIVTQRQIARLIHFAQTFTPDARPQGNV